MKRIFILASERSGSNLLRTLLDNHSAISAPVAPHFLNFFGEIIHLYGDLKQSENWHTCLNDFVSNANHVYHNWNLNLSSIEIDEIPLMKRNLIGITDFIYTLKAKESRKEAYASKGISNYEFVGDILNHFPECKFIFLHRDPRDHVASWLQKPLFLHSTLQIIKKWKKEQDKCLYLKHLYPESIFQISYEDLIGDSVKQMTNVLNFLELPIEPNCFQTKSENAESKRNKFWTNLSQPINKTNQKKYLNSLTYGKLNIIETFAKDTMLKLKYDDFVSDCSWAGSRSYWFHMKELATQVISRLRHRRFYNITMKDLKDKIEFQKILKDKLIKNLL